MKHYLLVLLMLFVSMAYAQKGKTILAIFAHPDDEGSASPVLAKYAREGAAVYIAAATDGALGVSKRAGIPAGDGLVKVRAVEMHNAAAALGINPPILLGLPDQLNMEKGLVAQYTVLDSLRKKVTALFNSLQPDVVITWGPSGWSGHPDHRLVGDMVTEVFQSMDWKKPARLYYPEIPTGALPKGGPWFATVNPVYLTVRIGLSDADVLCARNAWLCHKSQYTPKEANSFVDAIWDKNKPVAYFRPFADNKNGSTLLSLFP